MNLETTFYIFRHGETFATKAGTSYGLKIFSADILPEAKPPLERMGRYLQTAEIDFAVSSRIKRCRQTTDIINAYAGIEFTYDKRLNEYFLETYWQLKRRVRSLLQEIAESRYTSVAICTHSAVIAVLLQFLSMPNTNIPSTFFSTPPPGVLTIIKEDVTQQLNFNR